jgi:4-amino-4-deoxy-L-arabinose transferase-like glycosyltransferase
MGDLAGYDDAVYAHISRAIVERGEWLTLESNGYPALEHPPGFVWMQAALFMLFGFSDFIAKLPSALCGVGTVVLVYWLARRWSGEQSAPLAMFVILATPYFIKYTSHGMTDVPFTFLFIAAVCTWCKSSDDARWYGAVLVIVAYALLTRGVIGFAVPLTLALDLLRRTRERRGLALLVLAAATIPLALWYTYQVRMFGSFFWEVQTNFLRDKLAGDADGLRRYTGVFEYAWMLCQSYWPWLPFLATGLWINRRNVGLPHIWAGVMFAACALGGSRVLRYLLPAYPAFAWFVTQGLDRLVPQRTIEVGMRWIPPLALLVAAGIAIFPPVSLHAEEIRPIAAAVAGVVRPQERFVFYDGGQPRFDETGQLQWYGGRTMWILTDAVAFDNALAEPIAKVWVVDVATYERTLAGRSEVIARSGHLVCARLT